MPGDLDLSRHNGPGVRRTRIQRRIREWFNAAQLSASSLVSNQLQTPMILVTCIPSTEHSYPPVEETAVLQGKHAITCLEKVNPKVIDLIVRYYIHMQPWKCPPIYFGRRHSDEATLGKPPWELLFYISSHIFSVFRYLPILLKDFTPSLSHHRSIYLWIFLTLYSY